MAAWNDLQKWTVFWHLVWNILNRQNRSGLNFICSAKTMPGFTFMSVKHDSIHLSTTGPRWNTIKQHLNTTGQFTATPQHLSKINSDTCLLSGQIFCSYERSEHDVILKNFRWQSIPSPTVIFWSITWYSDGDNYCVIV